MNVILIPCHPKSLPVFTEQIVRLEGDGNYTVIHLMNGQHIMTSKSLSYYEPLLTFPFVRIHKSALINLHHILKRKTSDIMSMIDGSEVPIARRRKSKLRRYLKDTSMPTSTNG